MAGAAGGAVAGVGGRIGWESKTARTDSGRKEIPEFARLSFSQQGEDIVLYHALHDAMKIEKPTYMDVGAAHPRRKTTTPTCCTEQRLPRRAGRGRIRCSWNC